MNVLDQTKQKVMALLQISQDYYNEQVWEKGNAFAEYYTGSKVSADLITHSGAYWNWFKNQFGMLDDDFVATYSYKGNDRGVIEELRRQWHAIHSPETMVAYPNEEVVRNGYAQMIKGAIREARQKEVQR